jgi:hypothetical protein
MASVAERRFARATLALALFSAPALATAQPSSAAEALFEDGRRLMKDGDYPAACAKFQESQRLDPAGGTLMNLAGCHAKAGRTATAWAEFNDALSQAKRENRSDRVVEASKRIAELAPLLSRLTVTVDPAPQAGLEIRLDGTALGVASWGTPIPVDPGPHELTAGAPGFVAWKKNVAIEAKASEAVRIPTLLPAPAPATPPSSAPVVVADAPHRPVSAFVLGGAGLLAIGVGATFGIVAAGKKNDSDPHCTSAGCDKTGLGLLHDANTAAWVSDISLGAGVASLAVATYLFFATPSRSAPKPIAITPAIGPRAIGLGAGGRF